jgi:hypothetical protein
MVTSDPSFAISWRVIGKPGLACGRSPECEPAPCCRRVSARERYIEEAATIATQAAPIPPVPPEAREGQDLEIARWHAIARREVGMTNIGRSYTVSHSTTSRYKRGAAMRMESPDDYTRWIERAARRLEEAMRTDDVKQAEAEMKLIERTLKVLRQKFAEHIANMN